MLGIAVVLGGIELMIGPGTAGGHIVYQELYRFSRGALWKGISPGSCSCNSAEQQRYYRHGCVVMQGKFIILRGSGHNPADLGTCITAMIASYGTILPARQVAWGHLLMY